MKTFKLNLKTYSEGFSVIEALVAISILTVSIAGPMTIAQRGISTANLAKNQVTAFYLAQEVIESIRAQRENNILSGNSWTNGLTQCIGSYCQFDNVSSASFDSCGGQGLCEALKYDDSSGFYGYESGWGTSEFYREFIITQTSSSEISIDVTVSWDAGRISRDITVHETMFNWQ